MMSAAHDDLEAWWRETDVKPVRTGEAEKSVQELERRYTLPDDFRAYLLASALAEDLWDDEYTTWWSVSRIKNIQEEYEHVLSNAEIEGDRSSYLLFSDYLLWCCAWCVCCKPGKNFGKVAIIGGGHPDHFIADSFSDLIRLYLDDPLKFLREMWVEP